MKPSVFSPIVWLFSIFSERQGKASMSRVLLFMVTFCIIRMGMAERPIPQTFWDLFLALLVYAFGSKSTPAITDVAKTVANRKRPDTEIKIENQTTTVQSATP